MPFNLVANHRRAANLVRDKTAEVYLAFGPFQLEAIEGGNGGQFGITFEDEIAEEAQILPSRRGLAEEFAQRRQVVFVTDNAEQIPGIQGGAARGVQQFFTAEQRRHTGAFRHFQLAQRRADAPFFCAQAIDKQLPLAGGVHIQAGA